MLVGQGHERALGALDVAGKNQLGGFQDYRVHAASFY
jgi:hypothetical protein